MEQNKQSLPFSNEKGSPDWEISKLYSRAFEIIKKNKLLWILGLAAAGGGGANFNSSSNFDSKQIEKFFQNSPNTPATPETFNNVLGAATSSPFLELVKTIFSSIPIYFYFILVLEILLLVLIGAIINIIYSAWTQGMLIHSTNSAAEDKKPTIADSSHSVIPHIGSLVWVSFVPMLIIILAVLVGSIIITLTMGSGALALQIIGGILAVILIGALIYWLIMLTVIQIWAPRQILFQGKKAKEAFFSGFRVAKKKFWASLLLGLVNNILAIFIVGIPVVLLIALVVGSIFGINALPEVTFLFVILGIPLLLAAAAGFMLLSGALNAFKATVWTLAYRNIKGKYDA